MYLNFETVLRNDGRIEEAFKRQLFGPCFQCQGSASEFDTVSGWALCQRCAQNIPNAKENLSRLNINLKAQSQALNTCDQRLVFLRLLLKDLNSLMEQLGKFWDQLQMAINRIQVEKNQQLESLALLNEAMQAKKAVAQARNKEQKAWALQLLYSSKAGIRLAEKQKEKFLSLSTQQQQSVSAKINQLRIAVKAIDSIDMQWAIDGFKADGIVASIVNKKEKFMQVARTASPPHEQAKEVMEKVPELEHPNVEVRELAKQSHLNIRKKLWSEVREELRGLKQKSKEIEQLHLCAT